MHLVSWWSFNKIKMNDDHQTEDKENEEDDGSQCLRCESKN